ncbi:Nicotinate catabolism cluster-specific transcription factor [Frankliniella fusca]|uniref:Nicotinate catabolism cluster-specific transcription factor n=1 Tax=Frankliniella fusca TaxID=407009 RepID=A0AAE1HS93_9NEOP|nr:Nicotinate catabolism cluster-specific transcription factor [Frankliniella fusca]
MLASQPVRLINDDEDSKETTPEPLPEPLLPAESFRNVASPLPGTSPSKIAIGTNSGLHPNARNLTSDKSSDLNVPSFDILGAMAPTFDKVPASFSKKAPSHPISPAIQPFSFPTITKSILSSSPLSDRPPKEPCSILKEQPDPPKAQSLHSVKPQVNKTICHIKNGFFGFPEEDGRKLRKTRFHVNTNILASSLDLLDLHKNVGVSTGSPYCCASCDIVFSSVKHCKYHQSVITAEVTDSQVTDVQEDGFWLCPWCPTIMLSSSYFETHKVNCREKGRCRQESKASSVRKNASASSRRRSKPSSSSACGEVIIKR